MSNVDEFEAEKQFLDACPSFERRLEELRADWAQGQPSFFHILEELGRHLAQLLQTGRTAEIPETLAVVERILGAGNKNVVHATTLGLLTSLQSEAKYCGLDPEVLVGDLGPATWAWWNDLTKNWEAGKEW